MPLCMAKVPLQVMGILLKNGKAVGRPHRQKMEMDQNFELVSLLYNLFCSLFDIFKGRQLPKGRQKGYSIDSIL